MKTENVKVFNASAILKSSASVTVIPRYISNVEQRLWMVNSL